MKKTLAKITLFTLCVGIVIFLLLPFLETENKNEAKNQAEAAMAEPQIFTSNPLTTLVKRLSSLFRRNNTPAKPAASPAAAVLSAQEANERFGVPQYETRGAAETENETDLLASAPNKNAKSGEIDGDSMYLNDNGEWVLIRQVNPETSALGMHEINVKDNAYDSYVRQQQAAAFNPIMRQNPGGGAAPNQEEEEDSYWDKLMRPVKKLFRKSDAQQVANTGLPTAQQGDNAFTLAKADGLAVNGQATNGRYRSGTPDFNMPNVQFPNRTNVSQSSEIERMAALLNPEKAAEDIAQTVAEMEVPERNTPQQQKQYEEVLERERRANMEKVRQALEANMLAVQQNSPDEDVLQRIVEASSCKNASLPNDNSNCSVEKTPEATKSAQKAINEQAFYEKTHIPVPHVPILPVAGVVTEPSQFLSNPFGVPQDALLPEVQKSREIMEIMYKENCQKSQCFGVANAIQHDPALKDSIEMTGAIFAGDKQYYPTFEQSYVNAQLKKLGPEATDEQLQKAEKQAHEDFTKYAPAYVFVNEEQLYALQQKPINAIKGHATDDTAFLYVMDGHDALTVANTTNSHFFLFSRGTMKDNPVEQSQMAVGDMAENIHQIQEITSQVAGEKGKAMLTKQATQAANAFNNILKTDGNVADQWNSLTQQELEKLRQQKK